MAKAKNEAQGGTGAPEMQIEYWDIDKLIPYARNPRKNDDAVPKMAGLIKEFGFKVPVVIRSDGEVIDGHLRLKAARQLGMKQVPVVLADEWTPAQVKAFRLAVNRSAEWAEWDDELLKLELDDLKLEDFDLDLIGFEDVSLDDGGAEGLTDPDEVPDVQEKPVTRQGDIWLLGRHRLMCGDSTDAGSVALLMAGEKADIAFYSPPYNAGFGANLTKENGRSKYINGSEDDMPQDEYKVFLCKVIDNGNTFSEYNFCNIQMLANNKKALFETVYNYLDKLADVIIWDKGRTQPAAAERVLNSQFEFVFCFSKKANRSIGNVDFHGTVPNIIQISPGHNEYSAIHNAVFPVELPAFFITNFAKNSVLDLFCGTGTTIIAAEQNGRSCYGMELDPKYADVIVRRWQDFTGNEATLEGDGRTFAQIAEDRG